MVNGTGYYFEFYCTYDRTGPARRHTLRSYLILNIINYYCL